MRKHKKLLFVLVAVVVVLGSTTAYAAFSDVAGTTHEEGINWALENGITVGYNDNTYRPNNPVTRGQMATFLYRFNNEIVEPGDANGGGGDVSGTCGTCHDDTTLITSKQAAWAHSKHSSDLFFEEGGSTGCAGCHAGGAFSARIAAGAAPNAVTEAMLGTGPSPIDCRACHKIHETGTAADWALETTAAVTLYATPTRTYDGGSGNLCANCHQARRVIPTPTASNETTITSRYGPHYNPQASMVIGTAGAGPDGVLQGTPMMHYSGVADTCVGCHTSDFASHTFEADLDACTPCHGTVEDANVGGFQTEVIDRLNAIGDELVAMNLLQAGTDDPETDLVERGANIVPVPPLVPEGQAIAVWNYLYLVNDSSFGVHNPGYANQLLDEAEAGLPNPT